MKFNSKADKFSKENYILSFAVEGVTVFVTDIHRVVYMDLEVLFIIDRGLFKQYFTKKAFARALERGVDFYGSEKKFKLYKEEEAIHSVKLKNFFEVEIKDRDLISKETLQQFLDYTIKLCKDYTIMNIEHTDKAFTLMEQNPVIKKNLNTISTLKDEVRAFMNTVLFEDNGYLSHLFKILSDQFSIDYSILENLTQKELLDLYDGKKPDIGSVQKRQEAYVSRYDRETPYEGTVAREIIYLFQESKVVNTHEIRGQTASKGKVTGIVKIIPVDYSKIGRMNKEIARMKKGDILVARTTAPELMIACEKASAIVTDMGGLLSHAAIVSRELGIPCIVGTNNGTKIFSDGDKVEVDGDNGIVKIIKKYSPQNETTSTQ